MHILYQFDNKYAPYAGISIKSLLRSNTGADITIYIAAMDVSDENMRYIRQVIEQYNATMVALDVTEAIDRIKAYNLGLWNDSHATWLKMFILDQIEADRVLYIDCDTLISGDITSLYGYPMGDGMVGAVLDSVAQNNCSRLQLDRYYNAGVLLFNLGNMRQNDGINRMLAHLKNNVDRYPINDQDLINDYYRKQMICLPLRYNFQGFLALYDTDTYLKVYDNPVFYSRDEIEEARTNPVIRHMFRIFGDYPWDKGNLHPYRQLYLECKAGTPWSDMADLRSRRSLVFTIERILYRVMPEVAFLRLFKRIVER